MFHLTKCVILSNIGYLLFLNCLSSAELPASEISSRRANLTDVTKDKPEGEAAQEEKAWPEPQRRVCPPIRAALILPDGVPCPDGCHRFGSAEDLDPVTLSRVGYDSLSVFFHYETYSSLT